MALLVKESPVLLERILLTRLFYKGCLFPVTLNYEIVQTVKTVFLIAKYWLFFLNDADIGKFFFMVFFIVLIVKVTLFYCLSVSSPFLPLALRSYGRCWPVHYSLVWAWYILFFRITLLLTYYRLPSVSWTGQWITTPLISSLLLNFERHWYCLRYQN